MSELRLVIVDDHPLLRKGLKDLLEAEAGIRVVGEAGNGAQGLELIETLAPDVAVLDIDMPVMDGIELARILSKRSITTALIFLTIHKDRSLIRSMASLGIKGYVLKDSAMDEIVECVKAVASGDRWLSPKLNDIIPHAGGAASTSERVFEFERLTPAELRVLALIAQSKTNREIADELFISVRTVETHRYNICSKFYLQGSHSLLKFAIANKPEILNALNLSDPT